ncbi:MAG: glycosyl hydrolase [Bacteroidota bacterium]|nr:glycosyl hydrolase [Bacteroidota bacterium]MDP4225557.1 glycosyl hydrolase [Bacteroidota bacterium]
MNKSFCQIIFACLLLLTISVSAQTPSKPTNDLESLFRNPPTSVKPYVWWHWMGSNFSKSGITKDLEAMKAEGIGGATIFNLSSAVQESHAPTLNNPWPEQTYRSPAYWEALRFAAAEANRLGLEIGLHNTVGYSTTGGPWIDEERSMQRLVWSDTIISGGTELNLKLMAPKLIADEGWGKTGRKISFYEDVVVLAIPAEKKEIAVNEVLNLTSHYDRENGLNWNAPAGKWIVYRICHASTGRPPHPIPDDLLGKVLEADKMSVEQSTWHWKNVLDPVKEHLGEYLGKSFTHMLIDSYEAGGQNWTTGFREEFIKRKGYDPIPWLASFSLTVGKEKDSKDRRILGSEEQTARFDWDYQDVISQLFFDNGWKIGKQKLAEAKLDLQMEPYGGPFNTAQCVALADLPMAEFWTAGIGGISPQVPAAARAAGKTLVGAEAFTGRPEVSQFTEDPAFLKATADKVFSQGINRMILHHWVHQPFDDRYQPGMGMGWWGTHFGRNQTWFEPGKAFFTYMARCQALLQYGEQVSDYLCVGKLDGNSDLISVPDFLAEDIQVKNNKVILPTGRSYAFVVFPEAEKMLPEVAKKIKSLVAAGAVIVSAKPVSSPSLKDFPKCDDFVKQIAQKVWGNRPSNQYGKGYVFIKIEDALAKTGITPDYQVEKAQNPDAIKIAHRHSADADVYFVANLSDKSQQTEVSFRLSCKQPELWQAEDGRICNAPVWNEKNGRTSVSLCLKGIQSVFVVFRKKASKADHPVSVSVNDPNSDWTTDCNSEGNPVLFSSGTVSAQIVYASGRQKKVDVKAIAPREIKGPWKVAFAPKLDQPFELDFPELIDFSKHSNKMVNYFAGTATYRKTISIDSASLKSRILLDLGEMNDIAEIRVNGKRAGVLWYPPYIVDVAQWFVAGENKLEILVTNNWANRLIGDEQEPADFEWGKDRGEKMGRAMLAYPDWFVKNQPRPSQGRKTFSIWYYYRKDSPLKPAGLVGPVRLVTETEVKL